MSENVSKIAAPKQMKAPGWLNRKIRDTALGRLGWIEEESLTVEDSLGTVQLGKNNASLQATIRVHDLGTYREIAFRGALGGAEAYMNGGWSTDDLTAVIRILARNRDVFNTMNRSWAPFLNLGLGLYRGLRQNTRAGSRKNISAHYDLGNDFFQLFLDPTMTYSSGVFEEPEATMEEASRAKYHRIARKIELSAEDHVLEIGSGWGGFAIFAAREYGCRVTTATISREQYQEATRRIAEAGLSDRIEVIESDYRDLQGQYDKLVSIEMIEAVGSKNLGTFFRVCSERLKAHGRMALQAITTPDQGYESHIRTTDFIQRYIFPGGELVSTGAVQRAIGTHTDMRTTHLEDLTRHYARTLQHWRTRFHENRDAIKGLGLDERFLRMWEYYLSYCEGGFAEDQIGLLQMVFEKPLSRRAGVVQSGSP